MLTGRTVSVGTTAVDLLSGIDTDRGLEVLLRLEAGNDVWVGDASIATNNGFHLRGTEPIQIKLHGETIYGISVGASSVNLLIIGDK